MPTYQGNVTLYYIDGISRENTPYFSSLANQTTYFQNRGTLIADSFYVPHYKDVIKFETDDVAISSKYNYLSILFNDKYYYYFITGVEYISEDVIQVSIEMDTVQTFMFNILYHDGIVERMHIDRWIYDSVAHEYHINRDYIRENLSNNVWSEPIYKYISLSELGFFIAQSKVYYKNANEVLNNVITFKDSNDDVIYDSSVKYFAPFYRDDSDGSRIQVLHSSVPGTTSQQIYNQYVALGNLIGDTDVETIMYIPFNPFNNVESFIDTSYNPPRNAMKITGTMLHVASGAASYFQIYSGTSSSTSATTVVDTSVTYKTYGTIKLCPGPTTAVAWYPELETSMVDENYCNYCFGERSYAAGFPLYYTDKTTLYLKYTADISQGSRLYGITDDVDDTTFSKSGIVTAPPIFYTKINSTWLNWIAQNRATIPMAALNVGVQAVATILSYGANEAVQGARNYLSQRREDFYSGDSPARNRALNQQSRFESGYMRNAENEANKLRAASGITGSLAHLTSAASSAINAYYAPDSVKQTSMQVTDYLSGSCRNVEYSIRVNDFDKVAYFYHQYGNLVNKPLLSLNGTIFDEFKTRIFFNYFKFSYIDLDLDVLCAQSMINDLVNRFTSGIRQWYNPVALCDYRFNNVERSLS